MSDENLALARDLYEAWNRGDRNWFLKHLTQDAEVRPLRDSAGFDEVYRGHQGWKKFWKVWRHEWSKIEVRVERMEDMGDRGVLVLLAFDGVERASGKEVSIKASHWLTFRDRFLSGVTVMAPETAERRRHGASR
jgi:ketosteroid isomerase-like protein